MYILNEDLKWICMDIITRICTDTNVKMQVGNAWILLMDMYVYLEWISDLSIHGENVDIYTYIISYKWTPYGYAGG